MGRQNHEMYIASLSQTNQMFRHTIWLLSSVTAAEGSRSVPEMFEYL